MNEYNNINNAQNNNLSNETSTNLNNNYNTNLNNNLNNQSDSKKLISAIIIIVVIIVCGIGIGIGIFFFAGPGKETSVMKLCKNVDLQVENYNQDKISYSQFFGNIMSDYNIYCSDEESDLCKTIKTYNDEKEELFEYQELEDCSNYNSNWLTDAKALCESTNSIKEFHNNNREKIADAQISEIKMLCDLANE